MSTVILVIHLLLAIALVGVILLQKSEGGALGIGGGGGGGGGFLSARGTSNLLTRATAILAAAFIITSVSLAILASRARGPSVILETPVPMAPAEPAAPVAPAAPVPE